MCCEKTKSYGNFGLAVTNQQLKQETEDITYVIYILVDHVFCSDELFHWQSKFFWGHLNSWNRYIIFNLNKYSKAK